MVIYEELGMLTTFPWFQVQKCEVVRPGFPYIFLWDLPWELPGHGHETPPSLHDTLFYLFSDYLACGYSDTAFGSTQRAVTPNYPSNYHDSANCWWTIYAPSGYKVQVQFLYFDTESSYDYIHIGKFFSAV